MLSSTILGLIGATVAFASPVHHNLHKKAIVWDVVTDIVYVTVTEGDLPSTPAADTTVTVQQTHWVEPLPATIPKKVVPTTSSKKIIPTTTSTPPPPPAPTTTSTTPPPPPPTTSEAPAPTTQEAAVVVASTPVEQPASSSAAIAAPAAAPSDLASTAEYYHNAHRANHSASALTWDQTLADYAAITAQKCVFAHDMSEGKGGYGQNIDSVGYGDSTNDPDGVWEAKVKAWDPSAVLANAITNDWYLAEYLIFAGENALNENFYGQANPPQTSPEWTHFSQIVWKSTTTVGCAVQYCGSGAMLSPSYAWFTVCNYGPAGNFLGEFATEVTESLGKAPVGEELPDGSIGVPTPWDASS